MPKTRSAAKKDKETWDAVEKDMKKKKGQYRKPGDMPARKAPKPPNPPAPKKPKAKPKAPEKPANKRTGQDYRDWADLRDKIKKHKESRKDNFRRLPGRM